MRVHEGVKLLVILQSRLLKLLTYITFILMVWDSG